MLIGAGHVKTFDGLVPLLLVVEWMRLLLVCNINFHLNSQLTELFPNNNHHPGSNQKKTTARRFFLNKIFGPPAFHPQIVSQTGFNLQRDGLAALAGNLPQVWPFQPPPTNLQLWTGKRRDHHNHLETCQLVHV